MKRLMTIALLMITATVYAAGQQYYSYPDATTLKTADRVLIYQNASGSRNITGSVLKRDVNTEPVLRGKFGRYTATGGTKWDGRTYMYFKGQKLVITPVAP